MLTQNGKNQYVRNSAEKIIFRVLLFSVLFPFPTPTFFYPVSKSQRRLAEELGDLLFSCVNVARFLGVDPESALTYTVNKFVRRFSYIERKALAAGENLEAMSLAEMDKLWEEAKKSEHEA